MAIERAAPGALPDRTSKRSNETPSDVSLVRQVIDGSHDALAHLYDRHGNAVFAAAMRLSRDRWIAAEVVQDSFLALWNRAEQFDPSRGSLPAWLLTIARNRAIDRLRAAGRHDQAVSFSSFGRADADDLSTAEWLADTGEPIGVGGPEPGPEAALSSKETRATIEDALASLAPVERCVIVLAYDSGLSQAEIAARVGWPIGTVKTRTRRALRHLRDHLERPRDGVRGAGEGAAVAALARPTGEGRTRTLEPCTR